MAKECPRQSRLQRSDLYTLIIADKDQLFPSDTYIIDDAAYPLHTWLLTSFKDNGHLRDEHKKYNYIHSSTRMVIERACDALKGRFRRLKFLDMNRIDLIPQVAINACTIHNICIVAHNSVLKYLDDMPDDSGIDGPLPQASNDQRQGAEKRDRVMEAMP